MGEVGVLALLGKWLPVVFTGVAGVISKLIHDKYKELSRKIEDNEDDIEDNQKEIQELKLTIKGLEGEKIGRPEFERVVGEFKTEVKEEFNAFRRDFKEQSREDREGMKRNFDALFKMIREVDKDNGNNK